MGNVVYVVPWAICHTEHMYIKRGDSDNCILEKGNPVDDWIIKDIVPNPDRRSKDIYVVLDVYKGFDFKRDSKTVSFVELSNSITTLKAFGYVQATEEEVIFLRQRILKLDKVDKKANNKATSKSNIKAKSDTAGDLSQRSNQKDLLKRRA